MLLDTNIVSYIYRSDTRAGLYTPHLTGQTLYLSFMTQAELLRWPLARNWSAANAQHLEEWIDRRFVLLPLIANLPALGPDLSESPAAPVQSARLTRG